MAENNAHWLFGVTMKKPLFADKLRKARVMRQQIIDDWKQFFSENKEQILSKVVRIEDLPEDDEWFKDNERGIYVLSQIFQKRIVDKSLRRWV